MYCPDVRFAVMVALHQRREIILVNGPPEEIIVIGERPGGGGGGGDIDHPTLEEKETYKDIAMLLTISSVSSGSAAAILAVAGAPAPPLGGLALVAIVASAAAAIGAAEAARLADEPPQPDFRKPVRVTRLGLSTSSLPQPEIVEAQPLFDVFNDLIPVLRGTLDAYERAQGASLAGDPRWQTAHGNGARLLKGSATGGLLQLANRMKQFRVAELDAVELDQSSYSDLQERAQRGELLPGEAREALLGAGLRRADLAAFEERVANHDITTLPEGPFADLVNDNADQLQAAALRLSTS
jgi:hypothetical protein